MNEQIEGKGTFEWTVVLENIRGNVVVSVDTTCEWRPKQAMLALYKGSPPPGDPTGYAASRFWAPPDNVEKWDTGQGYGPKWSAALIAMDGNSEASGRYFYVAQTGQTVDEAT